jgi:hypothetical protein
MKVSIGLTRRFLKKEGLAFIALLHLGVFKRKYFEVC